VRRSVLRRGRGRLPHRGRLARACPRRHLSGQTDELIALYDDAATAKTRDTLQAAGRHRETDPDRGEGSPGIDLPSEAAASLGERDAAPSDAGADAARDSICRSDSLRRASRLYHALLRDLHRIDDVVPREAQCRILTRAAATRVWLGRRETEGLFDRAEAFYGVGCHDVIEPLLADERLRALFLDADDRVDDLERASLAIPGDGAGWRFDGEEIPGEGIRGELFQPGTHRVERVGDEGVATAVLEVPEATALTLSYEGGEIMARGAHRVGATRDRTPPARLRLQAGAAVGASASHQHLFGVGGLAVALEPVGVPARVIARGAASASAAPLYLTRWEDTHALIRGDLLLGWRPATERALLPGLAVGYTGLSDVASGLLAEASITLRELERSAELSLGAPLYLTGGPRAGVFASLTVWSR